MSQLDWWKTACAVCALCAATAVPLRAQTFTTLFSFDGTDGAYPEAPLAQGTDGGLYGTTHGGGANGYGTVFKITPAGTLTALYSFCSQSNCADGVNPNGPLVQLSNGNLYGTTQLGGAGAACTNGPGCGTVFEITPSGKLTTLYSFCSQNDCSDGEFPLAGLVQGTDGSFYGTAWFGGTKADGTVFKITPSGALTTLHSFDGTDGDLPHAGLVQGVDGSFYGVTISGGAYDNGTVFKMTPSGSLTTIHSFGGAGGAAPVATLVQGTEGSLYGTASEGGIKGRGTVFTISASGMLKTLYKFGSQPGDGAYTGGLVQATDGNFYGTTNSGGANNRGTVFKVTPTETLTTLYTFCPQRGCTDGKYPQAGLVQDTNGSLYGATTNGGYEADCPGGCGTVFSLSVALGPFVETYPTSAKVGEPISILGSNLTGATSVTFNGTAATFTVESSSLITTTVPEGATTGTVQVVTPSGTLLSNVPFRVIL